MKVDDMAQSISLPGWYGADLDESGSCKYTSLPAVQIACESGFFFPSCVHEMHNDIAIDFPRKLWHVNHLAWNKAKGTFRLIGDTLGLFGFAGGGRTSGGNDVLKNLDSDCLVNSHILVQKVAANKAAAARKNWIVWRDSHVSPPRSWKKWKQTGPFMPLDFISKDESCFVIACRHCLNIYLHMFFSRLWCWSFAGGTNGVI
jgi:hypothetical protein